MRRLIDTHSHIFLEEFSADLDEVVRRAADTGIDTFVMPNINLASFPDVMRVCGMYPDKCHATIGLHPTDLTDDFRTELDSLYEILKGNRREEWAQPICAIGEVGLDLYWEQDDLARQQEAFERQIEWALEFGLPLIIHSRSASGQLCEMLDKYRETPLRGVFHCFSGGADEALRLMEYPGFMFGIGGVLTYRKSELPLSLPLIPRDRVITETDCPYLSPVPFRGQRNEPSFMLKVVERMAELWQTSVDEVADVTSRNALRLFGIQ